MTQPEAQRLHIEIVPARDLDTRTLTAVLDLCSRAYEDAEIASLYATFESPTHVIGYLGDSVASHALWVTRWLRAGDGPLLRTAYVELVATEPALQYRGFATQVMLWLREAVQDYELGALWPNFPDWYRRLGWNDWRGPLFIRRDDGLIATPGDHVMVLELPKTPALDLGAPLSAEWRPGELW
jgi:aminoglycoside 2'-N-acetyltransferase I